MSFMSSSAYFLCCLAFSISFLILSCCAISESIRTLLWSIWNCSSILRYLSSEFNALSIILSLWFSKSCLYLIPPYTLCSCSDWFCSDFCLRANKLPWRLIWLIYSLFQATWVSKSYLSCLCFSIFWWLKIFCFNYCVRISRSTRVLAISIVAAFSILSTEWSRNLYSARALICCALASSSPFQ